ncbi:unnamed protein product, partial [Phaeothamnion confervicola]
VCDVFASRERCHALVLFLGKSLSVSEPPWFPVSFNAVFVSCICSHTPCTPYVSAAAGATPVVDMGSSPPFQALNLSMPATGAAACRLYELLAAPPLCQSLTTIATPPLLVRRPISAFVCAACLAALFP